ncbi:hypothetical protein FUA23_09725 [Neolewinella aurantiaca]|uniref:TonB-dependent receptor plug domain-containing protein n=1 Tax=Neolewinella aurantiaca TaxID=2602767 RepID=A0A5C7FVU4_9BACT|nr:TonB-dependent receptor plug domain-containing protein [Neolewinella aurantiaca]TXF89717.1 hypothetical protein FUA23_09725 [Neolewinella aurantiaca]
MRLSIFALLLLLCTCVSAQTAGMEMQVRTNSALPASTSPLLVVDGQTISEGSINEVDPSDIASVSVYKDEKATNLYGIRARNGVVVIVTKSGNFTRPDYTLSPDQIPADLFTRYAELNFAEGEQVVYLLDGKPTALKRLRKMDTSMIDSIRVYKGAEKADRIGHAGKGIVVSIKLL